jgi:hypothetical protein
MTEKTGKNRAEQKRKRNYKEQEGTPSTLEEYWK